MPTNLGDLCKDCQESLTPDNAVFKRYYLQKRCRECFNKHSNTVPSRKSESRKYNWIQWKYGLTEKQYNLKLANQLNGCAICKQPCSTGRRLAVDHDHKTNEIRDLLCVRCNGILGLANDDEELLFAIIEYLKRHGLKYAV